MSTDDDPGVTRPGGLVIDAALELLDRQLVDSDDSLAGKVDDLELTPSEDDPHVLYVTAILSGPGALGPRLPGRLGRAWSAMFDRLHPRSIPNRYGSRSASCSRSGPASASRCRGTTWA